jgi:hypothetical protein
VLAAIVAVNVIGVSTGLGSTVRFALPGAPAHSVLAERHVTLYSSAGWLRGGPEHDGDILGLLGGLKRLGARSVTFDAGSSDDINFNTSGLQVLAIEAGVAPRWVYDPTALGPHDAFMLRHVPQPGDPPPCQRLRDGTGVYAIFGSPLVPFELYQFVCPGRRPPLYKRTAPLSLATRIALHPELTGRTRALIQEALLALHRGGVQALALDPAGADQPFFQPTGVERLAAGAQLPVPPGLSAAQLTPSEAFMFRKVVPLRSPAPCVRFPDGSGLYIVLGNPAAGHYVCPLRRHR